LKGIARPLTPRSTPLPRVLSSPYTMAAAPPQALAWKRSIQKAIKSNHMHMPYAKYVQLATVRPDGMPANRTVVFRGFGGPEGAEDKLLFITVSEGRMYPLFLFTVSYSLLLSFYKLSFQLPVSLFFVSRSPPPKDARSRKVEEVAKTPYAEVAWYFPGTRDQFRIFGRLSIIGPGIQGAPGDMYNSDPFWQGLRESTWKGLTDAARSQFAWPVPGIPRLEEDEERFKDTRPDLKEGPPLDSFCLVVLDPQQVGGALRTFCSSFLRPFSSAHLTSMN
jgi:pyridoxamine 5'-phosphate oxidase